MAAWVCVDIHEVALHRGYAVRELCLFGRARQGVNLGTFLGEIGHDLRSNNPGAACYENGQDDPPFEERFGE
jgi:hypothetical protein